MNRLGELLGSRTRGNIVEALALSDAASAKFWKVPTDLEQAYLLARAHNEKIDWPYEEGEARKADTKDFVSKLKEMLAKGGKQPGGT